MKVMNYAEMQTVNGGRKIKCAFWGCKAKFADNFAGKVAFGLHHLLMHCGPSHSPRGSYYYVNN